MGDIILNDRKQSTADFWLYRATLMLKEDRYSDAIEEKAVCN